MSLQTELESLIQSVKGARGACLLDANGEVVIGAGAALDRLRLIGAYQGIALATVRKFSSHHELGEVHSLTSRYGWGCIVLRPLKDGYFLILVTDLEANLGYSLHRTALTQERINAEI